MEYDEKISIINQLHGKIPKYVNDPSVEEIQIEMDGDGKYFIEIQLGRDSELPSFVDFPYEYNGEQKRIKVRVWQGV